MPDNQLFVVQPGNHGFTLGNAKFITWANGREQAKRKASSWLGGDPDQYIVTPISDPGDRVHIDVTLNI